MTALCVTTELSRALTNPPPFCVKIDTNLKFHLRNFESATGGPARSVCLRDLTPMYKYIFMCVFKMLNESLLTVTYILYIYLPLSVSLSRVGHSDP